MPLKWWLYCPFRRPCYLSRSEIIKKRLDFTEYGGAPLLGIDGSFIICHGSSKAKAIKNAIRVAGEMVEQDVTGHIRKSVEEEGVERYDSES